MRKNKLTSLSAPGIGYDKRIFCIDFSDKEIKTFINPLVIGSGEMELTREVCSSIPGKEYIRPRYSTVTIIYTNLKGMIKNQQFKGLAAAIVQHEIDHLDGITLADIGLEVESDFDEAPTEVQEEILKMYINSLESTKDTLIKDIESDPELKKYWEADKLYEMMAQGKIQLTAVQGVEENNDNKDS